MPSFVVLGFAGVGLAVFVVAWVTLAILILALVAASAYSFFRTAPHFGDDLREATMDLDPHTRRLFYERYAALKPKDPAIAWFLAVGLGPIGANLYRQRWGPFFGALVSLNGLGAWWLESIYTTPHLVLIENRASIAYAMHLVREELARERTAMEGHPIAVAPHAPRLEIVGAR